MPSFITANYHTNEPRASQARGAGELANAFAIYALSRALTAAGVARGTTATKAKIVNTLHFSIGGAQFSKAATDDFWTLSGTTVQASSWQKYLLLIDASGNASMQEGTQSPISAAGVSWGNISQVSSWAPFIATVGTTKAVAAVLTIATDATHTFVPGTTALNATGITATFVDGVDQSILPLMGNETGLVVANGG